MKILIIAPNWLGDLIISCSLAKLLKLINPQATITFAIRKNLADIGNRMKEVDFVIPLNSVSGQFGLYEQIKFSKTIKKKYDWAIILPITFKSALAPFFAGIKKRTGFLGEYRYGMINEIIKKEHRLGKIKNHTQQAIYLSLLNTDTKKLSDQQKNSIAPSLVISQENQKRLIKKFALKQEKPIVAFAMGSQYGKAKRWQVENFGQLAKKCLESNFQILLLGSPSERELAKKLLSEFDLGSENLIDAIGQTSLEDTVDLLALSHTLVTNDSGLMHLAAATGTKIVAIYGSTSPNLTPPLAIKNNQIKIFKSDLECSPCLKRECQFNHYNCLKQTKPIDVFNEILSFGE